MSFLRTGVVLMWYRAAHMSQGVEHGSIGMATHELEKCFPNNGNVLTSEESEPSLGQRVVRREVRRVRVSLDPLLGVADLKG